MWIMTKEGFLSAVQKGDKDSIVVRARDKRALQNISHSVKAAIIRTPNADYPYRVNVTMKQWAEHLAEAALDVDYSNFKNEAKKTLGKSYLDALMQVWSVMQQVEDAQARSPLTAEYLAQPVDHYFYEVWSPNGECVSDGVCTVAELPQLRRNVEAEWLELVTWPQPKYVGPVVERSHMSKQPHAPLVGVQWLPLIKVMVSMLEGLQCDDSRFFRVDFYSPLFSQPIYVQAKQFDNGIFTIEAVSNRFLQTKLTENQHQSMLFLGWELKDKNYQLSLEGSTDLALLAERLINTVVGIYGIDESSLFGFSSTTELPAPGLFGLVIKNRDLGLYRL
jgi:hypothetical protein